MRTSSLAAALLLAVATPAFAEMHKLGDAVAGHPGVTYADLMRQAVPDLKKAGDMWKGSKLLHYRHLMGKSSDNGPPDAITITDVDVVHAREAGHDRLFLLSQNSDAPNEWFAILAAFDDGKKPKLLDAANTGSDQYNGLREKPVLTLSSGTDAVVLSSTHSNSSQSYEISTPVILRGGKLVPALSLFTINDHDCAFSREQVLTYAAHGADIVAKVVVTTEPSGEDCGPDAPKPPKAGTRVVQDTYRWDGRKNAFVPVSGAVERLSKDNTKS